MKCTHLLRFDFAYSEPLPCPEESLATVLVQEGRVYCRGREQVQRRSLWHGGVIITSALSMPVGSLTEGASGQEVEAWGRRLYMGGKSDQEIAQEFITGNALRPL
jgi:hypothetical protein